MAICMANQDLGKLGKTQRFELLVLGFFMCFKGIRNLSAKLTSTHATNIGKNKSNLKFCTLWVLVGNEQKMPCHLTPLTLGGTLRARVAQTCACSSPSGVGGARVDPRVSHWQAMGAMSPNAPYSTPILVWCARKQDIGGQCTKKWLPNGCFACFFAQQ